jgi:hypothetical protein
MSPTGTEIDDVQPAREPVGRVHRDCAHPVVAEVLLHLCYHIAVVRGDAERAVDLRELVGKERVDDDALDLDYFADVLVLGADRQSPPTKRLHEAEEAPSRGRTRAVTSARRNQGRR